VLKTKHSYLLYQQFVDRNEDNMINFKEFVEILSLMCKADYTHRLKLLYQLHQSPCLRDTDNFEEENNLSPKSGMFKDCHLC